MITIKLGLEKQQQEDSADNIAMGRVKQAV